MIFHPSNVLIALHAFFKAHSIVWIQAFKCINESLGISLTLGQLALTYIVIGFSGINSYLRDVPGCIIQLPSS
jgi:hypothetical protein